MSIVRNILTIFGCLLIVSTASAQKQIRVLNAEEATINPNDNSGQLLIGNVQIEHQGAIMYCHKAFLYDNSSRAEAFGNVQINHNDTLNIYGDSLFYNSNKKVARIMGRIRMIDNDMTLHTDSVTYLLDSNRAYYNTLGRIESKKNKNVLTSKRGVFNGETKELFFRDSVVLKAPDYRLEADTLIYETSTEIARFVGPTNILSDSTKVYCEGGWFDGQNNNSLFKENAKIETDGTFIRGDSIYFFQDRGFGEMFGNISVLDTSNDIRLLGHYGWFDQRSETSMMTDSAIMIQYYETDTLFLHADTLRSHSDTVLDMRTLLAYNNVKFYKNDLQGKCDSLVFSEPDSTLELYETPILWSEKNQLTADSITLRTWDGYVHRMFMRVNAFIISEQDTTGFNQIKGKNMTGFFVDNDLRKIYVEGNGQTVYYAGEENEPPIGMNKAECSDILIRLNENEIETISFLHQPDATMYPMDQIDPNDRILKGFVWFISDRPLTPDDIFK